MEEKEQKWELGARRQTTIFIKKKNSYGNNHCKASLYTPLPLTLPLSCCSGDAWLAIIPRHAPQPQVEASTGNPLLELLLGDRAFVIYLTAFLWIRFPRRQQEICMPSSLPFSLCLLMLKIRAQASSSTRCWWFCLLLVSCSLLQVKMPGT